MISYMKHHDVLTNLSCLAAADLPSWLRQQSPQYPILLQGRSAYWTRLRRHAAGPGQQQQALRGEHLDVALRQGPPPDGVYRRGGEDQGRAAQREQDQGSRDEEASQRGRCRSGGGARRRWSGLNTGLWYHSSHHSQYHIWYHRHDIDYDIIYINMIS